MAPRPDVKNSLDGGGGAQQRRSQPEVQRLASKETRTLDLLAERRSAFNAVKLIALAPHLGYIKPGGVKMERGTRLLTADQRPLEADVTSGRLLTSALAWMTKLAVAAEQQQLRVVFSAHEFPLLTASLPDSCGLSHVSIR